MIWLVVALLLLIPLASVILDSQLGRAIAARLEGSKLRAPDELVRRIGILEGEVERLSGEVKILEEESAFLKRLLEERPPGGALPPGENSAEE
jgi:hypothetical protein